MNRNLGILYSLSTSTPRLAPSMFSYTTSQGVPLAALLGTSSISALCFASSFVGSGVLWGWLQNIVGVSNQVSDGTEKPSVVVADVDYCRSLGFPSA